MDDNFSGKCNIDGGIRDIHFVNNCNALQYSTKRGGDKKLIRMGCGNKRVSIFPFQKEWSYESLLLLSLKNIKPLFGGCKELFNDELDSYCIINRTINATNSKKKDDAISTINSRLFKEYKEITKYFFKCEMNYLLFEYVTDLRLMKDLKEISELNNYEIIGMFRDISFFISLNNHNIIICP